MPMKLFKVKCPTCGGQGEWWEREWWEEREPLPISEAGCEETKEADQPSSR